jgi:hypothetical protein
MVVDQNTTGITANPFRIIQAIDKIGLNAEVTIQPLASFGVMASVTGPNQIIMDTGYLPLNGLIGPAHIEMVWFTNDPTGYRDISGYSVNLEFWKMDLNGNETLSFIVPFGYDGTTLSSGLDSSGSVYFAPEYQYRFVLRSYTSDYIGLTDVIGIDFIKIVTEDVYKLSIATLDNIPSSTPQTQVIYTLSPLIQGDNTNYTFSTAVSFNSAIYAQIIPASPNPNLIASITNKTMTGFNVNLTHRSGTTWSGLYNVDIIAILQQGIRPV